MSKSESSAVTNASGHASAKLQTKPMTAMSAYHPLLKSSRGRTLWPDQRPLPSNNAHEIPLDQRLDDYAFSRTRQRTSSVTSVETIRLKVKPRAADALLKPKLPLADPTITKHSTRKRSHSATSPEVDSDDSGALQTGPRVRQRRDSSFKSSAAPSDVGEQLRGILKAKMPTGASASKLKEKLTPPQAPEESDLPRELRPCPTRPSSSVANISKTENNTARSPPVAFPSKDTAGTTPTRSKTSPLVSDLPAPFKTLPFQSLSTNTESRRTAPIRLPIPGARLNKYGCYELSASEFELAVTFPSSSKSNFEVWDQEDELFLIGPLSLHLTLKDPAKWDGLPVSHPDVYVVDINCTSTSIVDPTYPYCVASAAENNKYSVRYDGAKMRTPVGKDLVLDPGRGIAIDTLWFRTEMSIQAQGHGSSSHTSRRGWEMKFFVPIATRLFEKRETRAFQVDGLVSVWGEQLETKAATMSVSHLMREREMVRR
ncbi:hypothetical protein DFH08DRAFT_78185 [Mycena albidolilacea]|uniref:Uncharacterized protein n=1 Tax=Mycena albidolilacea TaxID=1033008 RepID=A0AAD7A8F5_9AGAR|nr:hypothetical protein DFH08DRAFT_78185 [Mycena albidolilacea]